MSTKRRLTLFVRTRNNNRHVFVQLELVSLQSFLQTQPCLSKLIIPLANQKRKMSSSKPTRTQNLKDFIYLPLWPKTQRSSQCKLEIRPVLLFTFLIDRLSVKSTQYKSKTQMASKLSQIWSRNLNECLISKEKGRNERSK